MKILATLIYAIEFTYASAYIYGGYPMRGSVALFERNRPDEVAFKYAAAPSGYSKSSDKPYPVKVKKEYTNADYQSYVSGQDSSVRSSPAVSSSGYNTDYLDGDGGDGSGSSRGNNNDGDYPTSSSTSSKVNQQWNLYANREKFNSPNKVLYVPYSTTTTSPSPTTTKPASASNKIFVHHDDDHNLYYHNHHYHPNQQVAKPTHIDKHVVAYKVANHLDDVLHTKVLDKPLIQKLSLAKVALIQLISLLSSLSAIKTIHVVAKASHHSELTSNHIEPLSGSASSSDYAEKPHYPHTLTGLILHFVAQLSRFNIEAKKNLIPNLLKVAGYASASSSSQASAHKSH